MNSHFLNRDLKTSLDHHAYFVEGDKGFVLPKIFSLIEKILNMKKEGNPDYLVLEYENFSIGDANLLKQLHIGNVFSNKKDSKRIFVVYFSSATNEAQNSLLKIFEEPNHSVKFFIVAPSFQLILPTLRSRFEIIDIEKQEKKNDKKIISAEDYLKMKLSEKIKFAKEISEKVSKEDLSKLEVLNFTKEISEILREKVIKKTNEKDLETLKHALNTISFFSDRSSSVKMLLDNLAISLE